MSRDSKLKKEGIMENNNYKTLPLFNDIEDEELQSRNRAVIMANIAETYTRNGKITPKGAVMILDYFNCIPTEQRDGLYKEFEQRMKERNFVVA